MYVRSFALALLSLCIAIPDGRAAETANSTHPLTVEDLLAVRTVSRVDLSPDGKWVLIVARGTNLAENTPSVDVYIQRTRAGSEMQSLPPLAEHAVWRADSQALTVLRSNADCTQVWDIPVTTHEPSPQSDRCLQPSGYKFSAVRWSADGQFLAFLAQLPQKNELGTYIKRAAEAPQKETDQKCLDPDSSEAQAIGMDADDRSCTGKDVGTGWMWGTVVASPALREFSKRVAQPPPAELWVLEAATGHMHQVSHDGEDVRKYDWSVKGHRLGWLSVVDNQQQDASFGGGASLYGGEGSLHWKDAGQTGGATPSLAVGQITPFDLFFGGLRLLMDAQSTDRSTQMFPEGLRWSPDGKFLALRTQTGIRTYSIAPTAPRGREVFSGSSMQFDWAPDSKSLYVVRDQKQTQELVTADVKSGRIQRATADRRWHDSLSLTRDHRTFALTLEDIAEPTRVYVGRIGSSTLREVVGFRDLNPGWLKVAPLAHGRLDWRSSDGNYEIYGITVSTAKPSKLPRPMIVVLLGAGMPTLMNFSLMETQQPILPLAAAGYTVLIANSRGRNGIVPNTPNGYDDLANHRTYFSLPWDDVAQGIKAVIAQGIADADHVGMIGESWGAALAGYGITQFPTWSASRDTAGPTFKVAILKEPVALDMGYAWRGIWGQKHFGGDAMGPQYGIDNPYTGPGKEFVEKQSALTYVDAVRTPTLLEFGAASGNALIGGSAFYHGLVWFNHAPAVLRLYPRTMHGFIEPVLIADSFRYELAWIKRYLPPP